MQLCLRARARHGWRCGYQDIATAVESTAVHAAAPVLTALEQLYPSLLGPPSEIQPPRPLSPRTPDLVPITILVGTSENHARTTLQFSAYRADHCIR